MSVVLYVSNLVHLDMLAIYEIGQNIFNTSGYGGGGDGAQRNLYDDDRERLGSMPLTCVGYTTNVEITKPTVDRTRALCAIVRLIVVRWTLKSRRNSPFSGNSPIRMADDG